MTGVRRGADSGGSGQGRDQSDQRGSDAMKVHVRPPEMVPGKYGEVSQPFETPLGWHILQLEAERQATDSDDGKRMAIRQGLRARKSDESYDDWVRQLRDQAFVDIRLDDH